MQIGMYQKEIQRISQKWTNMLPLAEEIIEESNLEKLDPTLVEKFLQEELEYRKSTMDLQLEQIKQHVHLQEEETQKWKMLGELNELIKDNPQAINKLQEILSTL